jgi:endonuclease/exonuclease/phosphatase family metal-dependent hydrolase
MKKTLRLFLNLVITFSIFSEVNDSIMPCMRKISSEKFNGKITKQQMKKNNKIDSLKDNKQLVMSFNMLFNLAHKEAELPEKYHWANRYPRIVEYLEYVQPDIIGAQELYKDQIEDLMVSLSKKYAYYGAGRDDGKEKGEFQPIFYNKDRFKLIDARIVYYSSQPDKVSYNSHRVKNALTYCEFLDTRADKKFIVLNTHFSFFNLQARQYEANFIRKFISNLPSNSAVILTGDFNTFPMRHDLNLPFNDGAFVINTITKDNMENSMDKSIYGHLGPISTTNYSQDSSKVFSGDGTPGVILDFIFVNQNVFVRSHAIDSAKVNNEYMSDHLPVLADVIIR